MTLEFLTGALVTMFVIVEPIALVPIFLAVTQGFSAAQRQQVAWRACLIAFLILAACAFFGDWLLRMLGISLPAFRIAGGLLVFWIAFEMVFEKRTQRREDRAQKVAATPEVEDVSVFPMAIPMLAGPGAIAAIMLLMNEARGLQQDLVVLAALAAVLAITMIALMAAGPIMRLFGDKVEAAITRVLGVLLSALAAQYVIDGLRNSFSI